ncbi:hypothetical protein C5167_000943, partial [Papaver somniferum]
MSKSGDVYCCTELHEFKFIDANENGIKWSNSDVQSFISIDPIHGPVVENARKAAKVAAIGSVVGELHLGGTAWRYSKSPHGAVLAVGLGAVVGYTVGKEAASHYYQLYRDDAMASQFRLQVVVQVVLRRSSRCCQCDKYRVMEWLRELNCEVM